MKRMTFLVVLCMAVLLVGCSKKTVEDTPTDTTTTVTVTTTTAGDATVYPFRGYVNASTLNVRPTPDSAGIPIGGLQFADAVTVLGREGDWYHISFGGGSGYISAQYVQDTLPVSTTAETTVTTTETLATTVPTEVDVPIVVAP